MYTNEQLQQQLHMSHELQTAFQERLYQEVDKVAVLKLENAYLQSQLDSAIDLIATLATAAGVDITGEQYASPNR